MIISRWDTKVRLLIRAEDAISNGYRRLFTDVLTPDEVNNDTFVSMRSDAFYNNLLAYDGMSWTFHDSGTYDPSMYPDHIVSGKEGWSLPSSGLSDYFLMYHNTDGAPLFSSSAYIVGKKTCVIYRVTSSRDAYKVHAFSNGVIKDPVFFTIPVGIDGFDEVKQGALIGIDSSMVLSLSERSTNINAEMYRDLYSVPRYFDLANSDDPLIPPLTPFLKLNRHQYIAVDSGH